MRTESQDGELVRRSADWRRGFAALPWRMPNFVLLVAMLQARQAVTRRSWSHPQQAAGED